MATKTNPYSPPTLSRRPEAPIPATAGAILARLLVASAVVSAFRAALYAHALMRLDLLPRDGGWVETASRVSWAGSLVLLIVTVAAYSFWIHGANRAVRSLGAGELQLGPGWAVAVSFLPVVNLVAPFRAVDELREAVAPSSKLPVRLWWSAWIGSLAWSVLSRFVAGGVAAAWRAPIHETLWAAAALSLLLAVRSIEAGLESHARSKASEEAKSLRRSA